jgi:membrane-associated phospholipid phosphatase
MLAGRDFSRTGEDVLVVAEAAAVTGVVTNVLKFATARRRPDAWAAGIRTSADDDNAFVSGHSSAAFAFAAAFGTVAMLRDYPGWPFIYAAGFVGATSVAYFRVAADRHWLTDVAGGAAVGTAIGVAMPLLFHRRRESTEQRSTQIVVTPVPLGVAGVF